MKKKAMIMAVASLGSMALIGTGFAGWVITADSKAEAGGVITAYDVADQRFTITTVGWKNGGGSFDKAKGKIVFGKNTSSTLNVWFDFNGIDEAEQLTDTFQFSVASKDENDTTDSFTVSYDEETVFAATSEEGETSTAWTEAVNLGLVQAPVVNITNPTHTLKGTTAVNVEVTVTFAWGDHFKIGDVVKNPYEFYNSKGIDTAVSERERPNGYNPSGSYTWADDALYCMDKINAINTNNFTITLKVARTAAGA